jgi:death on curing protein
VTLYPSLEEVLAAHARLLVLFGGALCLRDHGALEAALSRPQSGYYQDVIEQAAALRESLSQNHPFVDGNKRTAITVTAAFLRINRFRLDFNDLEAYQFFDPALRKRPFPLGVLRTLASAARPARPLKRQPSGCRFSGPFLFSVGQDGLDRPVSRHLSGWGLQKSLYVEPILREAHLPGCDQHEFSVVDALCRGTEPASPPGSYDLGPLPPDHPWRR